MNIGWVSVSPRALTGYGRETREICSRLLERHNVVCIGHEADVIIWGGKQELPLPSGKKLLSLVISNPMVDQRAAREMLEVYARKYRFDLVIAHWDAFALEFLSPLATPYLVYIPVDGPMTQKWANYVKNAHRVIAYSKFGYNELLKFFSPSKVAYIPHGVSEEFKPLKKPKAELRKEIEASPPIPEDCFLMVFVGANIGPRKNIPLLLRTIQKFKRVHIYLHTNAYEPTKGYDLPMWVDMLRIKDRVHFPTYNPLVMGVSDEELCRIFNAGDVYATNSCAEGFGLPILEAMACGLPVIAPRNSAQTEMVEGRGWLVENVDERIYVEVPVYVPQLTWYPVPDQRDLLRKMREAYENEDLRKRYGREARKFALQYNWKLVMERWFRLLSEVADELTLFKDIIKGLREIKT